jgi:hypothetical protein
MTSRFGGLKVCGLEGLSVGDIAEGVTLKNLWGADGEIRQISMQETRVPLPPLFGNLPCGKLKCYRPGGKLRFEV